METLGDPHAFLVPLKNEQAKTATVGTVLTFVYQGTGYFIIVITM